MTKITLKELNACIPTIRPHCTSDAHMLQILNRLFRDRLAEAQEATQDRVSFLRSITTCAEGGRIALVHGGMDCDCVRYNGHVITVPATVEAVEAAVEDLYLNAEGPIHWHIARPSHAATIKATSRDLALEAFENGHPWSIHC